VAANLQRAQAKPTLEHARESHGDTLTIVCETIMDSALVRSSPVLIAAENVLHPECVEDWRYGGQAADDEDLSGSIWMLDNVGR
jgi:hypothetical protein